MPHAICFFVLLCAAVVCSTTAAASWSYRMVDQSGALTSVRGRLEARASSLGKWGSVCAVGFDASDAIVACRSQSLATNGVSYETADSGLRGPQSNPIAMSSLACTGAEAKLDECQFVGAATTDCQHSQDVVLRCPVDAKWTTRLVAPDGTEIPQGGTSNTEGRLELRRGADNDWYTVCAQDVQGTNPAVAVCKELALPYANAYFQVASSSQRSGQDSVTSLGGMRCPGNAESLSGCSFSTTPSCAHDQDLYVACNADAVDATTPSAAPADSTEPWFYRLVDAAGNAEVSLGRLEVRQTSSAPWKLVCSSGFDAKAAAVACRSLGLPTASAEFFSVMNTDLDDASKSFNAEGFVCTGSEDRLDLCSFTDATANGASCQATMAVALQCARGYYSQPDGTTWQYRLINPSTGDANSREGRLEVRPTADTQWGTVCDDYFGPTAVLTACTALGYSSGRSFKPTYRTALRTESGIGNIYLDNVVCAGTEASLDKCWYSDDGNDDCSHSEDIYVQCSDGSVDTPAPPDGGTPAPSEPTPEPTAAGPWLYRLAGGNSTYGRLEVRPNREASWGSVCPDHFTTAVASVACTSLGFGTATVSSFASAPEAYQGSADQPLYWTALSCSGSEARLDLCTSVEATCSAVTDVVISCLQSKYEYRLMGGNSTAGRLEVRPTSSSGWGTVCDESFDAAEAAVACRSLGLQAASATFRTVTLAEAGASSQPIYFDDLSCVGNEEQLDLCARAAQQDCTHSEDTYLSCGAGSTPWQIRVAGGTGAAGRLEVRPASSASWGTVCATVISTELATVGCRALGFDLTTTSAQLVYAANIPAGPGVETQQVYLSSPVCRGTELRPELCLSGVAACTHALDVGIMCTPSSQTEWQFRLIDPSTSLETSVAGRLEVRPTDAATFGTVCDDGFDSRAANVACRSLGFGSTVSAAYRTVSSSESGARALPVFMDDVTCSGKEASLDGCGYSGEAEGDCTHVEDIYLECREPTVASRPTQFSFRLSDSTRPGRGRLEVRPSSSHEWGTVCLHDFDAVDAAAACRSLGFSDKNSQVFMAPAGSGPIHMSSVACIASEGSTLQMCPYVASSTGCSHATDVGIDCTAGDYEFRLVSAAGVDSTTDPDVRTGRLETRTGIDSEWGSVCLNSFTQASAAAACRTIVGATYSVAGFARVSTDKYTETSPPIMTNLYCGTGELDMLANGGCSFDTVSSSSCLQVELSCYEAPTTVPQEFSVRLTSQSFEGRGLVEVRPTGTDLPWGTICATEASARSAALLCRLAGYDVAEAAVVNTHPAPGSNGGPIYYSTVPSCTTSATRIGSCAQNFTSSQCTHDDDLVVDCAVTEFKYRLTGLATQSAGRLEVSRDNSTSWSTVCNGRFTAANARVACRGLGYSAATVAAMLPQSVVETARSETPILLGEISCDGDESTLGLCDFVYNPQASDCTHDNDVVIQCGGASDETGCSGASDCDLWMYLGYDLVPQGCDVATSIQSTHASAISLAECRKSAFDTLSSLASLTAVPGFRFAGHGASCDIYVCEPSAFTSAAVSPANAADQGFKLFAFVGGRADTLGFCTRDATCSSQGSAAVVLVNRTESCVLGEADCLPASENETAAGAPGYRIVTVSACTCNCDEGFYGSDCASTSAMTTIGSTVYIQYRGSTLLTAAELDVLAQTLNDALGMPSVTMTAVNIATFATYQLSALVASTASADSDLEESAVRKLMRPTLKQAISDTLSFLRPSLTLMDVAPASFAARAVRVVSAELDGSSGEIDLPPFSAFAASRVYTEGTGAAIFGTEFARTVHVDIVGAVPDSAGTASISLKSATGETLADCAPVIVPGETCTASKITCDSQLPDVPVDESMTVSIAGMAEACDPSVSLSTARRQSTTAAVVELEAETRTQLSTQYYKEGDSITVTEYQTSDAKYYWAIFGVSISIGFMVLINFIRICCKGQCCLAVLTHPALLGVAFFFAYFTFQSYQTLGIAYDASARMFVDEYRSEICDKSSASYLPHRISVVPVDGRCHQMEAYGTQEQTYFMKADCSNFGTAYAPSSVHFAFGQSEEDCNAADWTEAKVTQCQDESVFMPVKSTSELQYFRVVCTSADHAVTRVREIARTLDPLGDPGVATSPGALANTDRFEPIGGTRVTFWVGPWRSTMSRFVFQSARTTNTGSAAALSLFSNDDLVSGKVGVPVDPVQYLGETPRAIPPQFPAATSRQGESPMSTFGPLFNGFNGSSAAQVPSKYGFGAMRYHGIRGTNYDVGRLNLESGATITFWMRASQESQGFVFLASDAWTDEEGVTPIADRLRIIVNNPGRKFFPAEWTAYFAIYVDGLAGSITLLYHNAASLGSYDRLTFSDPGVLENVFDGSWHYIAFGLSIDRGRTKAQIYVDGATSFLKNVYQACFGEDKSIPAVRDIPVSVHVYDKARETVLQGGVAYVGHINAGVYGFQVHSALLDHQVIVALGSPNMQAHAAISVDLSRLTAGVLLGIFCVFTIVTITQSVLEHREKLKKQEEANQVDLTADAGSAASKGSSSASALRRVQSTSTTTQAFSRLTVVLPLFMAVCQNMTLYFDGWQWPFAFEGIFKWVYFPFSLDFVIIPNLPVYVSYVIVFAIAMLAMVIVAWLSDPDRIAFQTRVIDYLEDVGLVTAAEAATRSAQPAGAKDLNVSAASPTNAQSGAFPAASVILQEQHPTAGTGLPAPDFDNPMCAVSILNYSIAGKRVVGAASRAAIQNSIVTCYRLPNRPDPVFRTNCAANDERFVTVLVDGGFRLRLGGTVPRYVAQLASAPLSLLEKLELCGFVDCANIPRHDYTIADIYQALPTAMPLLNEQGHHRPAGLSDALDAIRRHYALAQVLTQTAPRVVSRGKTILRTNIRQRYQEHLRAVTNLANRAEFEAVTAALDDVENNENFVNDRISASVLSALNAQARRGQSAVEWLRASEMQTGVPADRVSETHTLFGVASAAGIPVTPYEPKTASKAKFPAQKAALAETARFNTDVSVIARCISEGPDSTLPTVAELLCLLNPHLANDDDLGSPAVRQIWHRERRVVAARVYEMLHSTLKQAHGQVRANFDVAKKCDVAVGYVRLNEGTLKPIFNRIDLITHSLGTNAATATTKRQPIEIDTNVIRCPMHDFRLIPAQRDVHRRVRHLCGSRAYRCSHRNNFVFRQYGQAAKQTASSFKGTNEPYADGTESDSIAEIAANTINQKATCSYDEYYVCQDDACNFCVCFSCQRLGVFERARAAVAGKQYTLQRDGVLATLGLLFILMVQAIYLPAVKAAIQTLFCHSSLNCHFPHCYQPGTPVFLALALGSALVVMFFGIGIIAFLFFVVFERKRLLLGSTILRDFGLQRESLFRPKCTYDPEPYQPEGHGRQPTGYDVLSVGLDDESAYLAVIAEDRSMFKGLYEMYEFRWMYVHPVTFLFKVAILFVVLYSGEPNSLRLIVYSGVVECSQLLFYIVTEPYTELLLDVLTKAGCLHNVAQLGLMSLYRADTYLDPTNDRVVFVMIAIAIIYVLLAVVIIFIVVVWPNLRKACSSRPDDELEEDLDVDGDDPDPGHDEDDGMPTAEEVAAAVAAVTSEKAQLRDAGASFSSSTASPTVRAAALTMVQWRRAYVALTRAGRAITETPCETIHRARPSRSPTTVERQTRTSRTGVRFEHPDEDAGL
jgi:deleted-in-malignant-brain-tumors protein 1